MGKTQSRIGGSHRAIRSRIDRLNSQLKTTPSHLDWDKLPETEKFQRLAPSRKQLVDTVKLIAYRGDTVLAAIVREEWPERTTLAARCAICFAPRPTCCLIWSSEYCVYRSIQCRTRVPTAQSHTCWNISTRPSSPIPAPSCNSCTRSPAKPKPRTRFHNRIPQIRRSEAGSPWAGIHPRTDSHRPPPRHL